VVTRRSTFSPAGAAGVLVLGLVCAGLAIAPRVVRGYLALQWTRHLTARNALAPRVADARLSGRWAARAVDGLAPLPQAWEAARHVLDYSQRLRLKDAAAARAALTPAREALERAEASRWRRFGLGDLRERLWLAENAEVLDPDAGSEP
jgi:hypothetical protein